MNELDLAGFADAPNPGRPDRNGTERDGSDAGTGADGSGPLDRGIGRSVAWIGGVNGVAFLSGIVRQKVFAVFLGPVGLGALSLAMAFYELVSTASRLGIPSGLIREVSRAAADDAMDSAARVVRDTRRLALGLTGVVALASVLLADSIAAGPFNGALPSWAVRVVALGVPLLILAELSESVINGFHRIRLLAVQKLAINLVSLAATVALVVAFGLVGGVVQIATAAAVGLAISGYAARRVFSLRLHRPERVEPDRARAMLGRVLGVGVAVAAYHVAVSANHMVFRTMVVDELGLFENGLYQATLGLSRQYTSVLGAAMFVYLFPRLSAAADDRAAFRTELAESLGFVVRIAVPVTLIVLGFREWLVLLVFSREFLGIVPLFALSSPGDVLAVTAAVLRTALLARGWTRRYVVAGLFSEVAYLGFFLWGTRILGLQGSVGSYLVASTLAVLVYAVGLGRGNLPRLRHSGVMLGVVGAGAVGLLLALPAGTAWSRGAAVVSAGAWLFVERKRIMRGFR